MEKVSFLILNATADLIIDAARTNLFMVTIDPSLNVSQPDDVGLHV